MQGLHYLHHSYFKQLSFLNEENCLVDERFQVKLQFYGLTVLKSATPFSMYLVDRSEFLPSITRPFLS